MTSQPALFEQLQKVWDVRDRHMVKGLPQSYVFFLRCCCEPGCLHPKCQSMGSLNGYTWCPGGPPITHLPFVIPDSKRPCGDHSCSECKELCAGHYFTAILDTTKQEVLDKLVMPPSTVLKKKFGTKQATDKLTLSIVPTVAFITMTLRWLTFGLHATYVTGGTVVFVKISHKNQEKTRSISVRDVCDVATPS